MKHSDIIANSTKQSIGISGKNSHILHIEDLILRYGSVGAKTAAQIFTDIINNRAEITIKYDGSPAIIFGYNPENKKFFVGTKSVFNKITPKILYSAVDIKKYYSDMPNLAEKLSYALKYLKEICPKTGVFQGDLMFIDESVGSEVINHVRYISFVANTLTYATKWDDPASDKILRAKVGIAIHTEYFGKTIQSLKAKYYIDYKKFKISENVWLADVNIQSPPFLSSKISRKIKEIIKLKSTQTLIKNTDLIDDFEIYINHLIKTSKPIGTPEKMVKDFVLFYTERKNIEIEQLKTEKSKITKKNKVLAELKFLMTYKNDLIALLKTYKLVIEVKNLILSKLNDLNNIETFINNGLNFVKSPPEGFVITDCKMQTVVKLVNRYGFSKINFLKQENK